MSRRQKRIFGLSGLLVLMASFASPVLLPYPLFVIVVLSGWRLPRFASQAVSLFLSTGASTLILEISAWLDNYLKNNPDPALFHPQLIPDLLISPGVYAAWWLTWWLVLRRFRFTTRQVFLTTGLYGVVIEQGGAAFLAGLAAFPFGLMIWLVVGLAYGSAMGLGHFLARDRFPSNRDTWTKYL